MRSLYGAAGDLFVMMPQSQLTVLALVDDGVGEQWRVPAARKKEEMMVFGLRKLEINNSGDDICRLVKKRLWSSHGFLSN